MKIVICKVPVPKTGCAGVRLQDGRVVDHPIDPHGPDAWAWIAVTAESVTTLGFSGACPGRHVRNHVLGTRLPRPKPEDVVLGRWTDLLSD
jgi:hypothetical protein